MLRVSFAVTWCWLLFLVADAGADDLTEILKAGRKVQVEEVEPLRKASSQALAGIQERIQRESQLINGIQSLGKQPPETRQKEIQRLKERLAILERLQSIANGDAEAQAAALKKAERRLTDLQKQRIEADAPTQQKFREIYRQYATRHRELASAMAAYFKERGKGDLKSLSRKGINGQFHECSAYTVYYQDERPACQISVQYRPILNVGTPVEKIADGIDLLRLNDRNASLRAGGFLVSFYTQQPEGWNKMRIKNAVQQLVDLEGLAKVKLDEQP